MKNLTLTALSIVSLLALNLPTRADDTIYPVSVQNYLMQLAVEADFLRVGNTIKHDHFIIEIPSATLVEMANTACGQFDLGKLNSDIKTKIKTDSTAKLPGVVKNKLGEVGMDKLAAGVVKSAVNAHCPQHKLKLPSI